MTLNNDKKKKRNRVSAGRVYLGWQETVCGLLRQVALRSSEVGYRNNQNTLFNSIFLSVWIAGGWGAEPPQLFSEPP